MTTPIMIVLAVVGLALVAANFWYWWMVARHWHERFRRRCERRYGVTITTGMRGHWQVAGPQSRARRFAIEWLQLAFFMAAYAVWGVGMLVGVGAMFLIERFAT